MALTPPSDNPDEEAPRRTREVDANQHARGSMLLAFGRIIGIVIGFGVQMAMVRVLSPNDYGALMWCVSVGSSIQAVIALGLDRVAGRLLAAADEERDDRRVIGLLILQIGTIVVIGTLATLTSWLLRESIADGFAPSALAAGLLPLALILTTLAALDALGQTLFTAFSEAGAIFIRRYIADPLLRLTAVWVVWILGAGAFGMIIGLILASIIGILLYGSLAIRLFKNRRIGVDLSVRPDLRVRSTLRYSTPQVIQNLVWVANFTLPFVIVGTFGTTVDVAGLRAVYPIASLPVTLMSALALMLLPFGTRLWARGRSADFGIVYWRTAFLASTVGAPVLYLASAFPETTVTTLLGPEYAGSATLLTVMTWAYWLPTNAGVPAQVLLVANRTLVLTLSNISLLVFGVGLLLWLVPTFGAVGAAVAVLISQIAGPPVMMLGMRGLSFTRVDRFILSVSLRLVLPVLPLWILSQFVDVSFAVALVLSALSWVMVLIWVAPNLGLADSFETVGRIPVLGPLLTRRSGRLDSHSPYAQRLESG